MGDVQCAPCTRELSCPSSPLCRVDCLLYSSLCAGMGHASCVCSCVCAMRVCEGQYSRAEVAKHCTKEDLWIIIEDRVRNKSKP